MVPGWRLSRTLVGRIVLRTCKHELLGTPIQRTLETYPSRVADQRQVWVFRSDCDALMWKASKLFRVGLDRTFNVPVIHAGI